MFLRIGELAQVTGETVKTLRYWTDKGLLDAQRSKSGYRYFQPTMKGRIRFIRNAQALGFSLDEITSILELRTAGIKPCDEVREQLKKHLQTIQTRMSTLEALRQELQVRLEWSENDAEILCEGEGCIYLQDVQNYKA